MALSASQLSKYGLKKSSASSADHDKGIVAHEGSFYEIEGFKRNQKEGLDKDKGAAFSGALEADSAKAGWNPSTFNTATDVENALERIGGAPEEAPSDPEERIQLGERAAEALAGVETYQDWRADTGKSGFGQETDLIFGSPEEQLAANRAFAEKYKLNLKKHLTPGKASGYAGAGEMIDQDKPTAIAEKIIGKAKSGVKKKDMSSAGKILGVENK